MFLVFAFSKVLGSCPFGHSQSLPFLIMRNFSRKFCERSACFALFLNVLSGSWGLSRRVLLEPALLGSWVLSLRVLLEPAL